MSKVICIAGESGSGKTTSMRNLDPKSTYYIDADKKGLSWKGWRKQYNKENKNYFACDDASVVRQYIKRIAEACPGVKVIVVDTINGLMVADEMRRSKEKGYDKWVDLAACVWDLVCECYTYREDLTIVFTAHTQTDHDEKSGRMEIKFYLAASFASVLVGLLGTLPFIVDLWGDTEGGKSVDMMLATSVWANPADNAYIADFKTTDVQLEVRSDLLNNLPLMLDDSSNTWKLEQDPRGLFILRKI